MTKRSYVLYEIATGRITNTGYASQREAPEGFDILWGEQADPDLFEVQNGEIVAKVTDDAALLQKKRGEIKHQVNRKIGIARSRYITDLPGQDVIYQAKEREAEKFLAGQATQSQLPLLNAETGVTAPTATELADLWISMATQWRGIAALLENARMNAIASIETAASLSQLDQVISDLDLAIAELPTP